MDELGIGDVLVYDSRMIKKAIWKKAEVGENSSSSDEAQNEDNCRGKGGG